MSRSSTQTNNPSVCLVHDWLVAMRGGEKVLEAIAQLFPEAPIYTLFLERKKLSPMLQKRKIYTSFLQYVPRVSKFYRWLFPLFPIAIWFMNVQKFDLVISSSHCVAKAVRTRNDAVHICYCHTPMRYLWGFSEEYFGRFPGFLRWLIELYFKWLKRWDIKTSRKVTAFIANSQNTAEKIKTLYGKVAKVIYPPVELPDQKALSNSNGQGNYFLIVGALVPYKRIDFAIQAFNQLRLPLKIVGDGPLRSKLKQMIQFEEIELEGWLDQEELRKRYAHCYALIFPGEEDFGIVPLEAQGYGKPVVAYGKGGVTESVIACNEKGKTRSPQENTGLFFYEQNADSLIQAIKEFEHLNFDSKFIQNHARLFSLKRFYTETADFLKAFSVFVTFPG